MFNYRVYLLDGSGRIFHGEDIQAPDDTAAVTAARRLFEEFNASNPAAAQGVEIWRGRDLIFTTRA
jgi:hypothetical protein